MKKILTIAAPAKAILCGEHAVVYGEDAIAFGVDLKCYAQVYQSPANKNQNTAAITFKINIQNQTKIVQFKSQILKLVEKLCKKQAKAQIQGILLNEVQFSFEQFYSLINPNSEIMETVVLSTLFKVSLFCGIFSITEQLLQETTSLNRITIETHSQIPIGKGLGSSASFNSVLSASLLIMLGILKRQEIQKDQKHKIVINYLSKVFQKVEHGRPSGIDNFVSVNGGLILFNKNKNPPFRLISSPIVLERLTGSLSIGFVDSGVEKNTKKAVENVREKYYEHLKGDDKYKKMIQDIGTFPNKIVDLLSSQNCSEQQIQSKLFQILSLNHAYLRQLGLSNPQIQEIVQKFTVKGKSSAKITGAGMGGVVLIVGNKKSMQQLITAQNNSQWKITTSLMNTKGLQIQFQNDQKMQFSFQNDL